jgi:hypothetical protein
MVTWILLVDLFSICRVLPMTVKLLQFLTCVERNSKRICLVPCPGFVLGPGGGPVSLGHVGVAVIERRPYLMILFFIFKPSLETTGKFVSKLQLLGLFCQSSYKDFKHNNMNTQNENGILVLPTLRN